MRIINIYSKFAITPNLQEHMIRVAKVVKFIKNHWTGPHVDWDEVFKAALLHDVGNIVRFNFDKYPQFLGEEIKRVDYWKEKQNEIIAKYGTDDHDATKKMLEEINIPQSLIDIIQSKSFGKSIELSKSDNWIVKLLYYGDSRVMPNGIGTLDERLTDVTQRIGKYRDDPNLPNLVTACKEIEKQIQHNTNIDLSQITDDTVSKNDKEFLEMEV